MTQGKQWVRDYLETGKLENATPGPKGPHKVDARLVGLVKTYMKGKQRRGTRACVTYLKNRHKISVHRRTVQRILKEELGLFPYHVKKRPLVTEAHKEKRLALAKEYLAVAEEVGGCPWENFAFSDECRFHCEPKPNSRNDVIWDDAPDDELHYTPRSKYGGQSVEVWGCLTRFGKPKLVFIERPIVARVKTPFKSQDYIDKILAPVIPKLRAIFQEAGVDDHDWVFQQDGDRKHTAIIVQNWLAENVKGYTDKDFWPANSPDLNIIEHAWAVIWEDIKGRRLKTRDQLKRAVKRAWQEKVSPEFVQKLYESIPRRMDAVIAAEGKPTKY